MSQSNTSQARDRRGRLLVADGLSSKERRELVEIGFVWYAIDASDESVPKESERRAQAVERSAA